MRSMWLNSTAQNFIGRRYLLVRTLAVAVLTIGLVALWTPQVTGRAMLADERENAQMAVNLAHYGVMSLDDGPPYHPTNFREPVPVFASAFGVKMLDAIFGIAEPSAYFSGMRGKYLKYQKFLWLGLLSISAFWVVRSLTSSFWLGLLGVALVNYPFRPKAWSQIDTLFTEIPAIAILVPASFAVAFGFTHRRCSFFLLAGVLFGILALIKAIVLYVFLGLLLVLVGLYLQRPPIPSRIAAREFAVLVLGFACVLAPWLYRNQVQLGTLQITQRGGESLWERAIEDQITAPEYLGSFYIWAPPGHLQDWLGKTLNFSADDLLRGGRLQRLNTDFSSPLSQADNQIAEDQGRPEKAITLFRKARAERRRLNLAFEATGHPHPDVAAEQSMYQSAAALIAAHPWRHLALTLPFMWRGAAMTFPTLVIALAFALWRKRYDVALFILPALGIVLLAAFFTPFFGRYGAPSHLIALLSVLVVAKLGWDMVGATTAVRAETGTRAFDAS
jgi:hypothetical protein